MNHEDMNHEHHKMDYSKGYAVLTAIINGIVALSLLIPYLLDLEITVMSFMRFFMGLFFIVFGLFKLRNLKTFAITFRGYDPITKVFPGYGYFYPFIELVLGVSFLLNIAPFATNLITLVVLGIGAIGVAKELGKKNRIACACLGDVVELPLTTISLSEDLIMVAMAAYMLFVV